MRRTLIEWGGGDHGQINRVRGLTGDGVSKAAAARVLGVSATALDRWLDRGEILATTSGSGRPRIPVDELILIAEHAERVREEGRQYGLLAASLKRLGRVRPSADRRLMEMIWRALAADPAVSTAVLFGSFARGDHDAGSDVDVLIDLAPDTGIGSLTRLRGRLSELAARPIDLVTVESAERNASLMGEVLGEGRVLVDRTGLWTRLTLQTGDIDLRARREREELFEHERQSLLATVGAA